jgi:hypothetical protein
VKIRILLEVGAAIAMVGGAVATYHKLDQSMVLEAQKAESRQFQESVLGRLDGLAIESVIRRLVTLAPMRCNPRPGSDIPEKWEMLRLKYYELTGMQFEIPPCPTP